MLAPSPLCRSQLVTLLLYTWTTDADGGPVVSATVTVPNVVCSVQPDTPELVRDETGRLSSVSAYRFRFSADPLTKPRDQIVWSNPFSGRTHTLTVTPAADQSGRGATFEVRGVEVA